MPNHRILRARPLRAVATLAAALAIAAASLAAAPSPAAAASYAPHCKHDPYFIEYNACLRLDDLGSFLWNAHVGIDVYMNEQYAREIIACGARFQASLWGEDGTYDQFITNLPLRAGWPSAGPSGLGAEFMKTVHSSQLNEDSDGQDELYARVSYYDCHAGRTGTRSYQTGMIRGYF